MYLCGCVSLYLCMFGCLLQEPIRLKVLWGDAQEPMRCWHLFKHDIAKGHFETAMLILHNFFVFYYGYRCLEALRYISSWFKRCVMWCSFLRVHILVGMLLQDISDRTVQRTYLWVLSVHLPHMSRDFFLQFDNFLGRKWMLGHQP